MTSFGLWSFVLGSMLGVGIWLAVSALPVFRARPLYVKVGELIADVSDHAFTTVSSHQSHKFRYRIARRSLQWVKQSHGLAASLQQAGLDLTPIEYRELQLIGALLGTMLGLVPGILIVVVNGAPQFPTILGVISGLVVLAVLGWSIPSVLLKRAVARRMAQLHSELPTMWEFLALSISAGESLGNALNRLSRTSSGVFAAELHRTLLQHNLGLGMTEVLTDFAWRLGSTSLSRGIDQILLSFSRGTPLVDTLQALADESRADQRRRLIESAGKKEVAMLVPLVFIILPITIFFAIFPGVMSIQSSF